MFPGSLRLTDAQLDALMGNDIDQLLEICSDVLAQLENLMQLQATGTSFFFFNFRFSAKIKLFIS